MSFRLLLGHAVYRAEAPHERLAIDRHNFPPREMALQQPDGGLVVLVTEHGQEDGGVADIEIGIARRHRPPGLQAECAVPFNYPN